MNTLSPLIRKQAELVGIICGIAGGVLANTARSNALVLWIVSAAVVAGAVGNLFANAGDDPGLRPRAGIRAGVLTAIIAGAVAVLGFTMQSRLSGFAVMLPALLAIPPAAFFGLLGSLVISMLQNPEVRPLGEASTHERNRPSVMLIAIMLGSVTGYLSPFIAVLLPSPAPRTVHVPLTPLATPTPPPTPTPAPTPRPIPPPPWRHEAPPGFADAHPSQLDVLKDVSLGGFDSPLRFAFASDGHTFAFARSTSAITVLDLNEPETTASFFVAETPQRFGFAPDGNRLFCISSNGGKFVVSRNRAIRLPLPAGALDGVVDWAADKRIFVGDKVLDLDTLSVSPAPGNRASVKAASHSNIQIRSGRRFIAAHDSSIDSESRHVLADSKRDYSILAPAVGEFAFLSPDATKLLFVRDGELRVVYFKLSASRERRFTADMGATPPAFLADALKARKLIAMLCPPIINPLNDKPVAADLSRIKAVLSVDSWEGQTARLCVKEDYRMKMENGDAVALLLTTEHGRTTSMPGFENWWSLVRDMESVDAPALVAESKPEPPKRSETQEPPRLPTAQPRTESEMADLLRVFIQAHHAKSSRGDVNGLVADYAERVDHLQGSVVDREAIRKEELDYHSPGTRVSETIVGDIKLTAISASLFRATYTIRYEQVRPSGSWARGLSDIELVIDVSRVSPRVIPQIVRQRANNHDKQKGP